jgi:MinD-like ATPase involved in chromosome partitioning or flagellar assembly
LCLAKRLASRRRKIIVVEGNFVAPKLSAWLDAAPTCWWQDVLERKAPLADAIIRAADDQLDLLPIRADTEDPLRLVASADTITTAGELRDNYELVLIDLGAFFDPLSQPLAMELVYNMSIDVALAVSGPEGADPRDVATVAEYLGQRRCDLLGMIENRAKSAVVDCSPRGTSI